MQNRMPPEAIAFYCKQVTNKFLAIQKKESMRKYLTLCAQGLDELSSRLEYYLERTVIAEPFLEELLNELHKCADDTHTSEQLLPERGFAMLVCLAVIFREEYQKQEGRQLSPIQAEILRFFEESDEWQKGDGKLATDYYYFIIPRQAEKAAFKDVPE